MDPIPIITNPVLGELAKTLATTVTTQVVSAAGKRVGRALAGSDQQQALRRASETGLLALLECASPALRAEELHLVRDIFTRFFDDPAVARALAGLLRGRSLPVESLTSRFDAIGFDAATLPNLDFAVALTAFQAAFVDAAMEEQALQGLMQTADARELVRLTRQLVAGQQGLQAAMAGLHRYSTERSDAGGDTRDAGQPTLPANSAQDGAAGAAMLARVQGELRWDAACRALTEEDWTRAEALTREALALAPDLPDARSLLGLALADHVLANFRRAHSLQDPMAYVYAALDAAHQNRAWRPTQDPPPLVEAGYWLEAARAAGDDPGGRVSEMLACIYGITGRFEPMMALVTAAAAHGGDHTRRRLRAPARLIALAHGCGNTPERLQALGELVGVALPVPEARLRRSIERMDLTRPEISAHGIVWYVMGQPASWMSGPRPRFPTGVRIFAREEGGQRVGQALYQISETGRPIEAHCIPSGPAETLPVATLVRALLEHFIFLAPAVE